jgi:hypothetical protein
VKTDSTRADRDELLDRQSRHARRKGIAPGGAAGWWGAGYLPTPAASLRAAAAEYLPTPRPGQPFIPTPHPNEIQRRRRVMGDVEGTVYGRPRGTLAETWPWGAPVASGFSAIHTTSTS